MDPLLSGAGFRHPDLPGTIQIAEPDRTTRIGFRLRRALAKKYEMTPLAIAFTPNYFVPAATMLRVLFLL